MLALEVLMGQSN